MTTATAERPISDRTCPKCGARIRSGLFACRSHWYQLPEPLRTAINETYALRLAAMRTPEYEAARQAHIDAKRAAAVYLGGDPDEQNQ
jgi:hypothetical protein